ncbi:N-acetyl-gamma-glutamyl-phosphate reductase [Kamptonema cortianum]|nr:N-acetyl-gamma-glutamyl-phosphate reductase [Geitlerinema splendidum]MDK3156272.1 N-acetyl-gamma-glutamyl-phosphate reductase [Kamptonema cortianum]
MKTVGVVGASGFLGSELVRLLLSHPMVALTYLGGQFSAGKRLADIRPGFSHCPDLVISEVCPETIARSCETVFLALPHGESAAVAQPLLDLGVTIIDLGSDFRLSDPSAVDLYYKRPAPSQQLLDQAIYCLPELTGAPPRDTKLIAVPGCFATGLNLLVAGLHGIADLVHIFGITGSSGSGISPSAGVHHSLRPTNFLAYKSLNHQHEGEVRQLLRKQNRAIDFTFVPHSAPMVRGIHLTTVVKATAEVVEASLRRLYANQTCIIIEPGPAPVGSVIGTNLVRLGFESDGDFTAVFCAMDNLLKGGSGQAVQIFNLLNNFPETEGLPLIAAWP